MPEYYRIAILTGAAWIFAGHLFLKIRRKCPAAGFIRPAADFLILLVLFLSPFFSFWFSWPPQHYAAFVIRFDELVLYSLLVSLITDWFIRWKYYRQARIDREKMQKFFLRDLFSVLIISSGILLFTGFTVLLSRIGASIPAQVLLPVAALLLIRHFFLLLLRIPLAGRKKNFGSAAIRLLQAGNILDVWICIVQHIENHDFPEIRGFPDNAAVLYIIILVTCAAFLTAGLQLLYNARRNRKTGSR